MDNEQGHLKDHFPIDVLRVLLEQGQDTVFVLSKAGIIEYISSNVEVLYGYKPGELIGKHIVKTTPTTEVPRALHSIIQIFKGKPVNNFITKQIQKDGQVNVVEVNAIPVLEGKRIKHVVGVIRKLKDEMRISTALGQQQRFNYTLMQHAGELFIVLDDSFNITFTNARFFNDTGYGFQEVFGRAFSDFLHESDREVLLPQVEHFGASGNSSQNFTFSLSANNGIKQVYEGTLSNLSEDEEVSGLLICAWNINARIELEDKLKEATQIAKLGYFTNIFGEKNITVSKVTRQIFGLEDDVPVTIALWMQCVHPDDKEEVIAKRAAFIENSDTTLDLRYRIIQQNTGATRWVLVHSHLIKDTSGGVTGNFGTFQDVTDMVLKDRELHKHATAIEQTPVSIIITDSEGIIEYVNPAFESVTGYSKEEAVGQNPRILKSGVHDDGFYKKLWDTISSGKNWSGTFCDKRKDGTLYWEQATISPITDGTGKIQNYLAIKEDITDQKRMKDQLTEQNNLLSSIYNSSDMIIFSLDKDFRYLGFNDRHTRAMKNIWGVDIEEGHSILEYIHDTADRKKAKANFIKALAGERFVLEEEYGDAPNRSWWENSYEPLMDTDGTVVGLTVFVRNISARKTAENALTESEEKFRRIFNTASNWITLVSDQGILLDCNDICQKLLGYQKEELLGTCVLDFFHPEDKEKGIKSLQMIIDKGLLKAHKYRWLRKDGREIQVNLNSSAVYDANGRFLHSVCIVDDLTGIISARDKLREQLRFNETILKAIPDGVDVVDTSGTILYANDVMQSLFGKNLVGRKCYETYKTGKKKCRNCPLEKPFTENKVHTTIADNIKGGRIMEITHAGLMLDGRAAYLEIFRDITKREKTQKRLKLSDSILRNVETLVCVTDQSGSVNFIAPSVENMLGFSPEELMGRQWWSKSYLDKKEASERRASVINLFKSDKEYYGPYVRKVRKKDGGFIWVIWKDVIGDEGKIISVGQDVTNLIETEQQLRAVNKDLETFVYRVSHDVRGPLASAIGVAKMLNSPYGADDHDQLNQMLMTALRRMDDVVCNLSELGVIKQGAFVPVAINLRDALDKILMALDGVISEAGLTVKLDLRDDVVVMAEDALLKAILQNLIQNAVKYRSTTEPSLLISARRRGKKVLIRFKDNGPGIAKKFREKIFDMFYRADNMVEGTGLGLYIAKTAVEKLGGHITVESEIRKGSTFKVILPGH